MRGTWGTWGIWGHKEHGGIRASCHVCLLMPLGRVAVGSEIGTSGPDGPLLGKEPGIVRLAESWGRRVTWSRADEGVLETVTRKKR
jgi:hypothetical protein